MKKISVLSGGLDSTILTYKIVKEFGAENIIALTFNYGQRHNIEIEKSKITCTKLGIHQKILDISFLGDIISGVSALSNKKEVAMPKIKDILGDPQPPTYVPYRNMILNAIAFSFAESNEADSIYTGLQNTDAYSYWDTSPMFVDTMNSVSNLNRQHQIMLIAPFANMTKKEEILIGKKIGVPFEDTWTCYSGEEGSGACATCPSCSERIMQFAKAGIKDACSYTKHIDWEKLIKKYSEDEKEVK